MHTNRFVLLSLLLFSMVGCLHTKVSKVRSMDEVRFEIDDRRGTHLGGICAVTFNSNSRFVHIPCEVFVATTCSDGMSPIDILLSAYLPRTMTDGKLVSVYRVKQAAERFAELEALCQNVDTNGDLAVSATLYRENAFPRTYLIDVGLYHRVVDSWWVQRDSSIDKGVNQSIVRKQFPLREENLVGFRKIIQSGQYRLVAAFPDDDLTVLAHVPKGEICHPGGFFRLVGMFFSMQENSADRFWERVMENIKLSNDATKVVRVVIW